MSFDQNTQGVIKLKYYPSINWPMAWPAFVWQGYQLTPGSLESCVSVVHFPDHYPVEELLFQIYPKLTWIELWKLSSEITRAGITFRSELLWQLYGFRESLENNKWQMLFANIPDEVMTWWIEKDFGARDLAPLKAVPNLQLLQNELLQLAQLQLSKSDGQRALEWLVDLHLMANPNLTAVFQNLETGHQLLTRLEELRFPTATQKKKQSEELLKRLSWPRRLQARVSRVGDLSGFEIKFFVHNRDEFIKNVEGLQAVAHQLNDHSVEKF